MELFVDADFQYILARLTTRTPLSYFAMSSFMNSIMFLAFFTKGLALGTFFGPMVAYLAVTLNKQAQKTMDYYKMFWMNMRGDAHSTRNKGRLSHERMGCFVWTSHAGKRASLVQTIFNCTKIKRMYKNWDQILTKSLKTEV